MTIRDRREQILGDVEGLLEELHDEAMAEIAAARDRADEGVRRHQEATEELAATEAEISRLSAERKALPDRAYRAGMDEDYALEDELRERYKNLRPAIESLEDRRGSLKNELHRLCSRPWGHFHDVDIEQYARAASVAHERRTEMEAMRKRLTDALDVAVNPVVREHEDLRGAVVGMGEVRKVDTSPVGRGVMLS